MSAPANETAVALCALVVHWGDRDGLGALLRAWPGEPRCALVVVDNEGAGPPSGELPPRTTWISARHNLGFAGGVNRALRATSAPFVLLLNPDAHPQPGALAALLDGFARHPEAAGLAPRLVGAGDTPQHRWQLRPLPRARDLLGQALFLPLPAGAAREPEAGEQVAQPAAAALALRREVLVELGGLDEGFYPAWFEDVDLCRRLAARGHRLLYWPRATFRHGLGGSVESLGYGAFLWVYARSLRRYAATHHSRWLAGALRLVLAVGAILRLALLPLRRPRRAPSRAAAARALLALAVGAISGWRLPRPLRDRFARPPLEAS
ncbi:MAG TPA: glycosyltransferase [Thermoanaerobaculia bacterium]|nr:glycosyltransferase [Thermoanaerobaculia bacterium]